MGEVIELSVGEVIFREDLYPRLETSAVTVQKYAEDLGVLPPIEVNQRNELIDGWHRWTAHKKAEADTIPAIVVETESDAHLLELAIERNAKHGLQLSQEDKQDMARSIYNATPERDRDAKKAHLAKLLSVSERTVRGWLSRIDKDTKEKRDKRIFELWMACWTQEQIAAEVGCSQSEVDRQTAPFTRNGNVADLGKTTQAAADHATDFDPPIYNIWRQQTKTSGNASHFGNSEVRWVDNLLYLYTQPFDIVVDPFAGSGSTAGLCKKRLRRYWVSDRKVGPEYDGKFLLSLHRDHHARCRKAQSEFGPVRTEKLRSFQHEIGFHGDRQESFFFRDDAVHAALLSYRRLSGEQRQSFRRAISFGLLDAA